MIGPGPLHGNYAVGKYGILFRDSSNRATRPGIVSVDLRRNGRRLNGAEVTLTYHSLDMNMGSPSVSLVARGQGRYSQRGPQLGMGGRWRITVSVAPHQGRALVVNLTDLITR